MKLLLSLFVMLITAKECKSNSEATKKQTEDITITYQASSRGFFEEISVSNNTVTFCNDVNRKSIKTFSCSDKDWNECLELLSKIKTKTLPDLKAPTSKRLFDGAPHATLIIKNKEEQVSSSSFDHGEPPAKIKALVEKLLSIKKMVLQE